MILLKCKICETEFTPKNKTHVYCSSLCRGRAREEGEQRRVLMNAYRRKWKEENSTKSYLSYRNSHLLRNFGITQEQYNALLSSQDNRCAICLKHQDESGVNFAVDHDHVTSEIRGLLCGFCNRRFLGKHRDPEKFLRAYQYLNKGTGLFVPDKKPVKKRKKKHE